MSESMKDYEKELEASMKTIEEGDILTGTVISVDEKEVILDLKYYAEGVIPAENFSRAEKETKTVKTYQTASHTAQEFNKVCNILSEYGKGRACTPAGEAHLIEHGELISTNVLQQLIQL